jgi:hypothetical protein
MTDVFTAATTAQTTTEEDNAQTNENYLNQLVGEGKKFKDLEALAKGKLEADRHIGEITKTLDELRAELSKQDYAKSLLEQMSKGSETRQDDPPPNTSSSSNTENTTQSASDIESLVEKVITEKEKNRTVTQNLSVVSEEMEKQFGDKAGSILKSKSQELNISVDRLKEIAAESPTAFFQMIGVSSKKPQATSAPQSSVRSETFSSNLQDRDFDYYQKLRKESRSLYYSPKVQNMMLQDRTRLGDRFYKS